jgi:hypothetical protein
VPVLGGEALGVLLVEAVAVLADEAAEELSESFFFAAL